MGDGGDEGGVIEMTERGDGGGDGDKDGGDDDGDDGGGDGGGWWRGAANGDVGLKERRRRRTTEVRSVDTPLNQAFVDLTHQSLVPETLLSSFLTCGPLSSCTRTAREKGLSF